MVAIDFNILQVKYHDYAVVFTALREWFDTNFDKHHIEVTELGDALKHIKRVELAFAIVIMLDEKMLTKTYRLCSSNGYLDCEFDSIDDIFDKLTTNATVHKFKHSFGSVKLCFTENELSELKLVTILKW